MKLAGDIKGEPSPDPFDRDENARFNGRNVAPGTELTVRGIKGRCRFHQLVTNPRTERQWVDVINEKNQARSVALDDVVTVHRIAKTRENTE